MVSNKLIIGGREKILLPQVSRDKVLARIDTGAKSSSVHCDKFWIEIVRGKKVLYASILNKKNLVAFPEFKTRRIKSSNGISEKRYAVKMRIMIGPHTFESEFTLSNRKKMKNPVLLGRKFLRGRFLTDVSRNFILSGKKKI